METLQKTLYNHVGSRIRFYRKLKNMTQDQLAAAIHKSESTLSKYESGQIAIDVGSLWLVGVPAAWVAGLIFKWDITLVYLVTYLEQLSKAAAAIWRYRQSRWIRSIVREDA